IYTDHIHVQVNGQVTSSLPHNHVDEVFGSLYGSGALGNYFFTVSATQGSIGLPDGTTYTNWTITSSGDSLQGEIDIPVTGFNSTGQTAYVDVEGSACNTKDCLPNLNSNHDHQGGQYSSACP